MIPGWPYSVVAALEPGRTSWTAVLDAVRLGPDDDATAVTAAQVREVVSRLIAAGQWRPGDPEILIVADAGYDVTRLAFVLADLPVVLLGRLRSDRVLQLPGATAAARHQRPARPGTAASSPWHDRRPGRCRSTSPARRPLATARRGPAAWDRLHPRLTHRTAGWNTTVSCPSSTAPLIRLQVDHLPGDRHPKPVWLWCSATGATPAEVTHWWQAFLRRFDIETSKPQCCHSCGLSALSSVPSSAVLGFAS